MLAFVLAVLATAGPISAPAETVTIDTAQVTLAGNTLVGSVQVVHVDGRVLLNGYQVYPSIPRTPATTVTFTITGARHDSLMQAFYATEDWSDAASIRFFERSPLVGSAWVTDNQLWVAWTPDSTGRIRRIQVFRPERDPHPLPRADRSAEYFTELVALLQQECSVYIGTEYLTGFNPHQELLPRVRQAALRQAAQINDPQLASFRHLIDDLRNPRDLNDLRR